MEKTTVLARMRFSMAFNQETKSWLERINNNEVWFVRDSGNAFLSEYRGQWRELLLKNITPEIDNYFRSLGISEDHVPRIDFGEEYVGSWIVDMAVSMVGPVGTAYTVLKGVSEIPKIAEGLTALGDKIANKIIPQFNDAVRTYLDHSVTTLNLDRASSPGSSSRRPPLPPPPAKPVSIGFTIDARPMRALTPAALKHHALHLSVGVSREAFVVENLGTVPMTDLQIGIFRTDHERHQWSYGDAFTGTIPLLSGGQTITKRMGDFSAPNGVALDFSDVDPVYVDCWVSDSHGIYLFRFFLDQA